MTATATRTIHVDYCVVARRRVARKAHDCKWGICSPIQPGEVYLEVVELPGGLSGYADTAGRPVRMAVCARCLIARDRKKALWDLDPIPFEQAIRLGVW